MQQLTDPIPLEESLQSEANVFRTDPELANQLRLKGFFNNSMIELASKRHPCLSKVELVRQLASLLPEDLFI